MKLRNTNNGGRTAFTLIELLVVITIIAILAAILFPVFASAREKGRQSSCASNMRQIGIAIRMYSDDYDGEAPKNAHNYVGTPIVWVCSLAPYVANVDAIRVCPSDQRKDDIAAGEGTSYVMNEYIGDQPLDAGGNPINDPDVFPVLDQVRNPAETMLLFEIGDELRRNEYQDHTHSRSWFRDTSPELNWSRILAEIEPDRHRIGGIAYEGITKTARRNGYDRTKGVANYLYCDTHVKAVPAGRIKGWADSGFNFAKPPK